MATGVFLFTDIEGSTRLWSEHRDSMLEALVVHDRTVTGAVERWHGSVFKHTGDGLCATFPTVGDAIHAAVSAQCGLAEHDWGVIGELCSRMAIHLGEAERRGDDWFGPGLNRAARLMAVGHGGQVLVSSAAMTIARDAWTPDLDAVDLGVHRLRDLSSPEHVWQIVGNRLRRDFPPLRSLGGFRGNLPSQLSAFFGREAELDVVLAEVLTNRLVTLVGPGGVGKTRLALQSAASLVEKFPDGVWFVELAPLSEGAALEHALAATIGLVPRRGYRPADLVVEVLRDWRTLIVVDNCEHLLDAVRPLVSRLLVAAADVAILATSRESLRLPGEVVWPVPTLPVNSVAVELFTDRASGANPAFAVDDDEAETVRAICRRLDGVPLAIELAAARMRSMTARELLGRLDQRFRLLRKGAVVSDGRHASLQAALDWSFDLLREEERRLFVRLSVFAGGFGLEAAHAVAGAADGDELTTLDSLDALVDKSLIVVSQHEGVTRYDLLETMRQYGVDGLSADERDELGGVHARYFAAFAERAREGMRGADDASWVVFVEENLDNLRAGLQFAVDHDDADLALRIVAGLEPFNVTRRNPEIWAWAHAAVALPGAEANPLIVPAYLVLSHGGHAQDHEIEAELWARRAAQRHEALRLPPNPRLGMLLGYGLAYQGRIDEMGAAVRESLDIAEAGGSDFDYERLEAMHGLLWVSMFNGRPDIPFGEHGLAEARRVGNTWMVARASMSLGLALGTTDPERGRRLLDEAVALCRRPAYPFWVGTTLVSVAVAYAESDPVEGLRRLAASLDEYRATGARQWIRRGLRDVMGAFAALGNHGAVAIIDGASKPVTTRPDACAGATAAAVRHLGAEAYDALKQQGAALADDELSERIRREIDLTLT